MSLNDTTLNRIHSDEIYIRNRALGIMRNGTPRPKSRWIIGKLNERYRRSKALSFAPTVANDQLAPLRVLVVLAAPYSALLLVPSALDIFRTGQIGLLDGALVLSLTTFFAYAAKRYRRARRVVQLAYIASPDSQTSI